MRFYLGVPNPERLEGIRKRHAEMLALLESNGIEMKWIRYNDLDDPRQKHQTFMMRVHAFIDKRERRKHADQ